MKSKLTTIKKSLLWIFLILTRQQRVLACVVIMMSIVAALLETLGVSAIMPLVSAMTQPESVYNSRAGEYLINIFRIRDSKHLLIGISIATIILYVIKNAYFVLLSWVRAKFSYKIKRELSITVLDSYLSRPYDFFLKKNTGEILRSLTSDIDGFYEVLYHLIRVFIEFLTIFMIGIFIVLIDWRMACCVIVLALIGLLLILFYFQKKVKNSGREGIKARGENNKNIMEAFHGIKEILIMKRQEYYKEIYKQVYQKIQNAEITCAIAQESPAYIIEGFCVMGLLGFVCAQAVITKDINSLMPIVASVAVGAFRILPALGRISSAINTVFYFSPTVYSVYANLEFLKVTENKVNKNGKVGGERQKESFERMLCLNHVKWKYEDADDYVLTDVNMTIKKGEAIGIIGMSGAGKSTLIDVILGLHELQEGDIEIDNTDIRDIPDSWSKLIGYVPQSIYLSDRPIRNNVAFGEAEETINEVEVWRALEQAQMADFVKQLPEGLDTIVGERGVRFSGGQQQRIAIARALYRKPQILVLDEATSALDNETEAAVMESIEKLQGTITLIIVAHRLTTVKKCDRVYEIIDGRVIKKEIEGIK